jgi:uncharacterized protein YerC
VLFRSGYVTYNNFLNNTNYDFVNFGSDIIVKNNWEGYTNQYGNAAPINYSTNQNDTPSYIITTNLAVKVSTIYQGQTAVITATLKDILGNYVKNQNISLTINKKTYSAITNSKGVATFKVTGLKNGNYGASVSFGETTNYLASQAVKTQVVKAIADFKITKILRSGNSYKVTIKNQGALNAGKTKLKVSLTVGKKTYYKVASVNSIKAGKSLTVTVNFFTYSLTKKYKKTAWVNYNKAVKEVNYANDKTTFL